MCYFFLIANVSMSHHFVRLVVKCVVLQALLFKNKSPSTTMNTRDTLSKELC